MYVTTKSGDPAYDIVARAFWPRLNIDEDPVCGSMHTVLVPYWSRILKKDRIISRELSARGGTLYGELCGDRVKLSGKCRLYLSGEITVWEIHDIEERLTMFRSMRRYKQQISEEECIRILMTEKRGVLSMSGEDGYPYGIPLNHWYNPEDGKLYVRVAFLGFENQSKYEKDMPLRVIGYDGAAYRAEISQGDRYPVITLVLYFGDEPWGKNRAIYDAIDVPEMFRPFVSDYKINVFEIAHLPKESVNYFHSDFRIVVDYFVHRRDDPDYRPKDPARFQHVDEVLKLMAALTGDERFIEILMGEGGKPKDMCEVLDRAEARGIDKSRIESIRNIMETLKLTAQQAMNALKIPANEQSKYLSKL